jgi:hypothetical protein
MQEEAPMPDGPDRPAEPATPDSPGARSSFKTLGMVLGAVLLVAAAGVGGYLLGHSAADASGAKRDGIAKGRAQVREQYKPAAAGYQAIYQAGQRVGRAAGQRVGEAFGVRRGQKVGLEQGRAAGQKQGQKQGQAQGVQTGAQAALGNLPTWETGTFYLVKLQPGTLTGVSYQVQARNLMQANRLYEICTDNPGEVCSRAAAPGP